MSVNFLFEIGTEEIPARFIPLGIKQLKENFEKILNEYKIDFKNLKTYATPRRLAISCWLSPKQTSTEKLIWGPPAHIAFDETGNPKQAAIAFAQANLINIKDLQIRQKGKGYYVCALIREEGLATENILPEILNKLFFSLNFPKMMRWGSGAIKFVRPIRWLTVLYEGKVIQFELNGVKSDCKTQGHRFLVEETLNIKTADEYEKILEKAFVIPDPEKRRQLIVNQIKNLANMIEGEALLDEDLVEEVVYLVEHPVMVLCSYPEKYISLPEELLITVMKDHQRYFAVKDKDGKLKNYFIAIGDTVVENSEQIRKGAERVIKARFEDAKFYYEEDLKKGIEKLLEETKGIIYHEKIGTLYDKAARIEKIIINLGKKLLPDKLETLKVAAKYCKADIASGVVKEFPELQGVMGGYYCKVKGWPEEVVLAIKEHYLPKGLSDEIPSTDIGCLLSIADRLDHLSSFFFLGHIPSGTEDPFGLRRSGNGIVIISLKKRYDVSIRELSESIEDFEKEEIKEEIERFLGQRVESYLELKGYEVNLIKTINDLITKIPVWETEERLQAVQSFMKEEIFQSFYFSVKRVSNIIREFKDIDLIPESFIAEEEKRLYEKILSIKEDLDNCIIKKKFTEALYLLSSLNPFITDFFDNVLVMDKDEKLRNNRIALLQRVHKILTTVTDLSKLY
ncbi:MAG: glycine--tRNA ligase subunit beta [Thermodesulfovibrio sp.]|nr:glycine--tRNA ligase subunit beta [Thermodesulfovibrio sp.]